MGAGGGGSDSGVASGAKKLPVTRSRWNGPAFLFTLETRSNNVLNFPSTSPQTSTFNDMMII